MCFLVKPKLTTLGSQDFGNFSKNESFNNAFIYYKDLKLKIHSYKLEYFIGKPITQSSEIDFSKELIGVIEYLQRGKKMSIFKKGIIKEQAL